MIALNKSRKLLPHVNPGQTVYTKDALRRTKWEPAYEGPFIVSRQDQSGAYVLKDMTGEELFRHFTIDQLRPIPKDSRLAPGGVDPEEKSYEIEKILDHNLENNDYSYLVKWKGYKQSDSTWEPSQNFDDEAIIHRYWEQRSNKRLKENQSSTQAARNSRLARRKEVFKKANEAAKQQRNSTSVKTRSSKSSTKSDITQG